MDRQLTADLKALSGPATPVTPVTPVIPVVSYQYYVNIVYSTVVLVKYEYHNQEYF